MEKLRQMKEHWTQGLLLGIIVVMLVGGFGLLLALPVGLLADVLGYGESVETLMLYGMPLWAPVPLGMAAKSLPRLARPAPTGHRSPYA